MISAIYVDDEPYNLIRLEKLAGEIENLELLATYGNGAGVIEECARLRPQVAFLDIEMPGISGLEFAAELQDSLLDIDVVFVTAFSQYAVEAFKVNAVDYLLKPLDAPELRRVLQKIEKRKQRQEPGELVCEKASSGESELICLGKVGFRQKGVYQDIRFVTSKARELFLYLLFQRGTSVDRWTLCELLWPETNREKVLQNLHTTIYRLKSTIREQKLPVTITAFTGHYALKAEGCSVDYISFERLVKQASVRKSALLVELTAAEQLYGGRLFAESSYIWAEDYIEALNGTYIKLLYRIAEEHRCCGRLHNSLEYYKKIVKIAAYEEKAAGEALALYGQLGDRIGLRKYYKCYKQQVLLELDCEPSEELKRKFQRML